MKRKKKLASTSSAGRRNTTASDLSSRVTRDNATPSDLATGSSAPSAVEWTLEVAIGSQVRRLRRQNDLSIAELAVAAGVSGGMLSKIENGQISPSLSTLQGLSSALNVPLSMLFSALEQEWECSYVPARKAAVIDRRGTKAGHVYKLLGHVLGGDVVVEPYLITLKEDAVPYIGFRHAGIEFIYMLTGEVVYRHGDQTYRLHRGDSLLFNSEAPHGPEILVRRPMTYLSIIIYGRDNT